MTTERIFRLTENQVFLALKFALIAVFLFWFTDTFLTMGKAWLYARSVYGAGVDFELAFKNYYLTSGSGMKDVYSFEWNRALRYFLVYGLLTITFILKDQILTVFGKWKNVIWWLVIPVVFAMGPFLLTESKFYFNQYWFQFVLFALVIDSGIHKSGSLRIKALFWLVFIAVSCRGLVNFDIYMPLNLLIQAERLLTHFVVIYLLTNLILRAVRLSNSSVDEFQGKIEALKSQS